LWFPDFRRLAQRSDPERISGTTLGGTGVGGNEISNTDLLSCSPLLQPCGLARSGPRAVRW
jgi:hypothetical protein